MEVPHEQGGPATSALTDNLRLDTERIIADDPVSITITRTSWTVANGKRSSTVSTLATQTVRLYSKMVTEVAREGDGDRFLRRREIRMLAKYDANVTPHSGTCEDVFTISGVKYRVMNARDMTWEGTVVGKQCTLEELQ